MTRHCYKCDVNEASYEAHLDWTEGLMLLCHDCAREEFEVQGVIDIRSLTRQPLVIGFDGSERTDGLGDHLSPPGVDSTDLSVLGVQP